MVKFYKVCLNVGPCFVAYGLLLPFDQTPLYEITGLPHLGNGNDDFFIATGCDVPAFELLGEGV